MSILGVNSMLEKVYQNTYNRYNTDIVNGTGFSEKLSDVKENVSFEDMWKSRFPGAYYHTMDASNIPQVVWQRNDFPFEKFFQNDVDESVLNWNPNGKDPSMDSSGVQSRLHSIAGQKSIVVPPALEEKMKNDPALAQKVMAKIENYIMADEAMTPDRICSYLIVLDENGDIARSRASSHGGNFTGPTEEEQRQFEAEQKKKAEKKAEYMRILEESALKRNQFMKEINNKNIAKRVILGAYKSNFFYE